MASRRLNFSARALVAMSAAITVTLAAADDGGGVRPVTARTIAVAGTGTDLLNGAVIHSKRQTPNGMVQLSTEIVELQGDLTGRVLYHVTSTFDFASGTLVNTGQQVYSGTVAGSEPVLLYDQRFRFEVNLKTDEEHGSVYLTDPIAGPDVRCTLNVIGTGKGADGNPTFRYAGTCSFAEVRGR